MPGEVDAGEVEDFSLVPIGGWKNATDCGNLGQVTGRVILPPWQNHLQDERMLLRNARQVIDDLQMRLKAGFGGFLRIGLEIIDTADAVEQVELEIRLSFEILTNL